MGWSGAECPLIVVGNSRHVDKKRILELMEYPWFQRRAWKKELRLMKKKSIRIEQQALVSKSLEFAAEEYLPQKIENGVLLL